MLSPRRIAQLGLSAACLTLVTSITLLVAGAADPGRSTAPQASGNMHVTPLATGQIQNMQADADQRLIVSK